MSKRTRRCPDCGAQLPQGAAMCSKCGYKAPETPAENTPRKIREEVPRPVDTSRWPDRNEYSEYEEAAVERKAAGGKSIWQIAVVLALIVVIVVIAVVLIIKMNAPASTMEDPASTSAQTSESFEVEEESNVHVIDPQDIAATEPPMAEEEPAEQEPGAEQELEQEEELPQEEEPEPTPEPTPEPEEEDFVVSEMNDTVYLTGNGVNLREGPGTEYDAVTSGSRGLELKRTGVTDNGWSRLEYEGETVYVSNSYVSEEKPAVEITEQNDTVYVTGDGVNLRKGPGTENDVIVSLSKGTELKRTGTAENGWTRVEYNGQEGYLSSNYVSTDKPAASVTEKSGTVVVTAAANLRSEPNENGSVLAIANANVELERTGVTGDWTRVSYNGQDAYIHTSLLKDKEEQSDPGVTEESGTLTVATLSNIRTGPGTSYDVLATVEAGTTLTKTGRTDDNWYRVTYNDQTGYIAASLVAQG